jgi:hypothetical protein
VLVVDPELQPFGALGARRLDEEGRRLLVPNIPGRAVIVDLTGATPFAVPAPLVSDPEAARRIDFGHRYVACGPLRPGLALLTSYAGDDDIARSLAKLVMDRLDGRVVSDAEDALPPLALAVRNDARASEKAPESHPRLVATGEEAASIPRRPSSGLVAWQPKLPKGRRYLAVPFAVHSSICQHGVRISLERSDQPLHIA